MGLSIVISNQRTFSMQLQPQMHHSKLVCFLMSYDPFSQSRRNLFHGICKYCSVQFCLHSISSNIGICKGIMHCFGSLCSFLEYLPELVHRRWCFIAGHTKESQLLEMTGTSGGDLVFCR